MSCRIRSRVLLGSVLVVVLGCGKPPSPGAGPAAANDGQVKLSQYDRAEYCDLAAGTDGALHAVFTDQPARDKPKYLYYRASSDGGKTWSEAKTLSDDESGNAASYGRLAIDGKGRVYAVWKYVGSQELLDGPGGHANGRLAYRCLEGGAWSKCVPLGDASIPSYSWFPAVDPGGTVHVVWSQMSPDVAAVQGGYYWYANLVRSAALDGARVASVRDLIAPKPILTQEEQAKMKAAGRNPSNEETTPRRDGLINLRGYVDAQGLAHFVAEHPGIQDGPTAQQTGKRIVHWDGQRLDALHAFARFGDTGGNTFNNPPTLLVDAAGKRHLIRAPENSERPCVRDYELVDGKLGEPVDVLAPKTAKGALLNWQVHQLKGGRMAVTAALSDQGGYRPEDLELFVSFSDGGGKWTAPACVTNNQARQNSFGKETGGGNAVAALNSYSPRFASVVTATDGTPCILMVTNENTIVGLTSPGVTDSGRVVPVTGTVSVDNPMVYFLKWTGR